MAKIYLSAALFTAAEAVFNTRLGLLLKDDGHEVFLPQDHAKGTVRDIYHINKDALDQCDLVMAVLDGADIDSGVAWEVGYACAKGIPVIGLRTDFRNRSETPDSEGAVNPMLLFSLNRYISFEAGWENKVIQSCLEIY